MIRRFKVSNFRCLEQADLVLSPSFNLIYGANASGKTSFLEALAYLGRGKSFRGASTDNLVRHGQSEFVLFGETVTEVRSQRIGVRNSRAGLEIRVDGSGEGGVAALAEALPLQVIDPEVHNLVAGGPELRRRFLDWVAFHVEHDHLETWRRFRRALRQRNAALKGRSAPAAIRSWNAEFVELGEALDASRRRALDAAIDSLAGFGRGLLGTELGFEYQQGWSKDRSLAASLEEGLERDVQQGATQHGPHRADLRIRYDERQARRLVSRGQQKLLASAMILAATETAQTALERPLLLLLDDPAAELDGESLVRLLAAVGGLGCQVVATSLEKDALSPPLGAAVFHVEQGVLSPVETG
ncbi:MAG: DNA replication/repair protein RecF [Gammaproteobacteria bacterium]|nr:DNA replication/repair protein RecF [Gammaproteobacteria bacterium]MDH5619199.1 DNA replication/repair protein RecF [Gammaproteobacteria bacterium]